MNWDKFNKWTQYCLVYISIFNVKYSLSIILLILVRISGIKERNPNREGYSNYIIYFNIYIIMT